MRKNQCAFCRGHCKIGYTNLEMKESKSEANVAMADSNDTDLSVFSLFITFVCCSKEPKWILDTDAITFVLNRSGMLVLKN